MFFHNWCVNIDILLLFIKSRVYSDTPLFLSSLFCLFYILIQDTKLNLVYCLLSFLLADMLSLAFVNLSKKDHRGEMPFSWHPVRGTIFMYYHVDIKFGPLDEVVHVIFSTSKVSLFSLCILKGRFFWTACT